MLRVCRAAISRRDGDTETNAAKDPAEAREAVPTNKCWPGWIWAVPVAALAIVGWLCMRAWSNGGPTITVTFPHVADIRAGNTQVKFQNLKVGTVASVKVAGDLKHLTVTLNLDRDMAGHLGHGTRIWVADQTVTLVNPSSLSAILSGPTIAIDPRKGHKLSHYVGLMQAPIPTFGEEGESYLLRTDKPGAIGHGTLVYYPSASRQGSVRSHARATQL